MQTWWTWSSLGWNGSRRVPLHLFVPFIKHLPVKGTEVPHCLPNALGTKYIVLDQSVVIDVYVCICFVHNKIYLASRKISCLNKYFWNNIIILEYIILFLNSVQISNRYRVLGSYWLSKQFLCSYSNYFKIYFIYECILFVLMWRVISSYLWKMP